MVAPFGNDAALVHVDLVHVAELPAQIPSSPCTNVHVFTNAGTVPKFKVQQNTEGNKYSFTTYQVRGKICGDAFCCKAHCSFAVAIVYIMSFDFMGTSLNT